MDRRPEQARIALTAIKDAARTSLTEVRSVLDVLRGGEQAPRRPAPDLGELGRLVEQAEAAGLVVRVDAATGSAGVAGAAGSAGLAGLPLAVSQAAYRIVQESLTNVVRHSGARSADVLVRIDGAELALSVTDDGRGVPLGHTEGTGNGIGGMRERAAAFGGGLTAGPGPQGGFRVAARIPLPKGGSGASAPTPPPAEQAEDR
jgi:signal transduction histidine kinase